MRAAISRDDATRSCCGRFQTRDVTPKGTGRGECYGSGNRRCCQHSTTAAPFEPQPRMPVLAINVPIGNAVACEFLRQDGDVLAVHRVLRLLAFGLGSGSGGAFFFCSQSLSHLSLPTVWKASTARPKPCSSIRSSTSIHDMC